MIHIHTINTKGLVGWLILLLYRVGWDIMGYESEPLPSYHELNNWSYSIMLSYPKYLSTSQVHLLLPGTTIIPSKSSLASAPPLFIAHIWGGRQSFTLWLPASPDVLPNGVDPCVFHFLHYQGVLLIFAWYNSFISPLIRCAAWWWNLSRTFSISPVTTQILMLYKSTDCATTLFVAPRARTIAPVFYITLTNIHHNLRDLCRLWYTAAQLILLWEIFRPK